MKVKSESDARIPAPPPQFPKIAVTCGITPEAIDDFLKSAPKL